MEARKGLGSPGGALGGFRGDLPEENVPEAVLVDLGQAWGPQNDAAGGSHG